MIARGDIHVVIVIQDSCTRAARKLTRDPYLLGQQHRSFILPGSSGTSAGRYPPHECAAVQVSVPDHDTFRPGLNTARAQARFTVNSPAIVLSPSSPSKECLLHPSAPLFLSLDYS